MPVVNYKDIPGTQVREIGYKGEMHEVTGITIRWLSKDGFDGKGNPGYGLRHFTAEPGGSIPAHSHFYAQTVFIMTGSFECYTFDPETDEIIETCVAGPGDSVYSPSMVPHGMKNLSETEEATFLCCICNIMEDPDVL